MALSPDVNNGSPGLVAEIRAFLIDPCASQVTVKTSESGPATHLPTASTPLHPPSISDNLFI